MAKKRKWERGTWGWTYFHAGQIAYPVLRLPKRSKPRDPSAIAPEQHGLCTVVPVCQRHDEPFAPYTVIGWLAYHVPLDGAGNNICSVVMKKKADAVACANIWTDTAHALEAFAASMRESLLPDITATCTADMARWLDPMGSLQAAGLLAVADTAAA